MANSASLLILSPPTESPERISHRPGVVLTRTPLRISFAGGGTDLPSFYEQGYGAVFSAAINKYVYVTVKRHSELFYEPIRINYSTTEQVEQISEINNDIARECLRMLNIEPPIYISTVADAPASSGLGGSSSFAVGLLNALHAYSGERVSAGQLAEEATAIEIDILKRPIGKQDQYVAAFGGLNFLRFESDGVSVEPQCASNGQLDTIFDWLMMFWTGVQHDSATVLAEQKSNTEMNTASLLKMRGYAHQLRSIIRAGKPDPAGIGRVLHANWQLKRELATSITNNEIDTWYQRAIDAGAEGGKLCGAGGGGFLLFVVQPQLQEVVRRAMQPLPMLPIRPEVHGSRVLFSE